MAESRRKQPTEAEQRKQDEDALAEAEEKVNALRSKLGAAQVEQGELQARVFREQPAMIVRVKPDAVVVHEGQAYHGKDYPLTHGEDAGEELKLDGPTAMALAMQGQVDIVRSV